MYNPNIIQPPIVYLNKYLCICCGFLHRSVEKFLFVLEWISVEFFHLKHDHFYLTIKSELFPKGEQKPLRGHHGIKSKVEALWELLGQWDNRSVRSR